MMKKRFIIQFLMAVSIPILLSFYFKRSLELLLSYEAFILNILYLLIPITFNFGIKKSFRFFRTPFNDEATVKERKEALHFFKSMSRYLPPAALATSIAVLCFYSGNMDNTIGWFWGIGWVTILYALLFCVVIFLPLRFSLEQSLISTE